MAGSSFVGIVPARRGVVLVRRCWVSLWRFSMWLVIGGYWDNIGPVTSFSPLDLRGSDTRFVIRSSIVICTSLGFGGRTGSTQTSIRGKPS
jgi:hypothetical protein